VKLRQATVPEEVGEVQKRVKFITHRMETAIANHEFEKARFYSEEERKEKENLRGLRERFKLDDASTGIVTAKTLKKLSRAGRASASLPSRKTNSKTSAHRAGTAQARHQPGQGHHRAGSRHSPQPRGSQVAAAPGGLLLFLGADRRRQDGSRPAVGGVFVWFGEIAGSFRHVGVHGEAFRLEADRRASRVRGLRRRRQLTERVRRTPYSVILLDEIEKAHPDVFNILLQVFEDGQLTDGLGNTVDFRNTIIIMTSNLGARHLQKRTAMGFQSGADEAGQKSMEDMVMNEVKRAFNPEFLNRLDE